MAKERYESDLKRAVSSVILSEINDSRIGWVTVDKVNLSPDYHTAIIFVSIIGDKELSLSILNKASGFIRHSIAKRLPWRRMPKLLFEPVMEEMLGE